MITEDPGWVNTAHISRLLSKVRGRTGATAPRADLYASLAEYLRCDRLVRRIEKLKKAMRTMGEQIDNSDVPGASEAEINAILLTREYILTPVNLIRGPTPIIVCATDTQLWCACHKQKFTGDIYPI
jgi:hypothetical protein